MISDMIDFDAILGRALGMITGQTKPWVSLRERKEYIQMTDAINEEICRYYENEDDISHREAICLTAYRLIRYITKEMSGLDYPPINKVPDLNDAIMEYYCADTTKKGASFQVEVAALEALSRSAYRAFKNPNPGPDDEEIDIDTPHDIM